MTAPSGPPSVRTIHALNSAGQYRDALAQLDQLPDTGVHLWLRGVALHHLKRVREAHEALQRSRALLTGSDLARMLNDQALFYTQDQQFRLATETFLAALKASAADPLMRPLVTYNLGWLFLTRLEFTSAHEFLQQALVMGEQGKPDERMTPRVGASTLDRATGQLAAARHRAHLATVVAETHRMGHLAYRNYSHALRHLGAMDAARDAQQRAVALAVPEVYRVTETLILGIIDATMGHEVNLEALEDGALALDMTRSLLHRAEQARRSLRERETRQLIQAALDQNEPFAVWDEAPLLHELYTLGRTLGFTEQQLPVRRHTFPLPTVQIGTIGSATLRVAGRKLPIVSKSVSALTLLAYLTVHQKRHVTCHEVGEQLYEGLTARVRVQRLQRDMQEVTAWLGDPSALSLQNDVLSLSSSWTWACDVSVETLCTERAQQVFLPTGRGAWVDEIRRLREDHLEGY